MTRRASPSPDGSDAFEAELDRHRLRPDGERERPSGSEPRVGGLLEEEGEGRWGWSIGRVLSALCLIAMVVFWVWAFSPLAPTDNPDQIDDPSIAVAFEARCAPAAAAVDALPNANTVLDLDIPRLEQMKVRAGHIDEGTAILRLMHADLLTLAPPLDAPDGPAFDEWLKDWALYLDDRDAQAENFRAGIDGPFEVATKGSDQVTGPIDQFASVNDMLSCITPTDV